MNDLNAILQKYLTVFSDQVVVPLLGELDELERSALEEFRRALVTEDVEVCSLRFAHSLKTILTLKMKVEQRFRSIERAVMNGF